MGPVRILIPLIFVGVFLIWILYRAFVKKDLKKNMMGVYTGLFFIAIWAGVYFWLR